MEEEDVASDRQLVVVIGGGGEGGERGDGGERGAGVRGDQPAERRGQLMVGNGEDPTTPLFHNPEKAAEAVKDRVYQPGVWTLKETMVLLEAKKREKGILQGTKRNSVPADEKWRAIAEYCWQNNVHRSKEQCRFKWENIMPDFKKVREHEDSRGEDHKSYFDMESAERKRLNLPPNLNKDLYTIMDDFLVRRPGKQGLPGEQGPPLLASVKKEARDKPGQSSFTIVTPLAMLEPPPPPPPPPPSLALVPASAAPGPAAAAAANLLPGETSVQESFDNASPPRDRENQENTPEQQQSVARRTSSLTKASARKRRKKGQDFQEAQESDVGGPATTGIGDSGVQYEFPNLPLSPGLQEASCPVDTVRAEAPSGSVLISDIPRGIPAIQLLRVQQGSRETPLRGSQETLEEIQTTHQKESRSEAREEKSSPSKNLKRGSALREGDTIGQSFPEQPTEVFQTPREGERLPNRFAIIEEKKDARHRELVALEREKIAASREAIALFASALNNMATAVQKVAELLQRQ